MPRRRYRLDKGELPDLLALEPKIRKKVMRQGAKVVALKARELAPVMTGALKKSINWTVNRSGVTAKVRTKSPHGHLVHDGTQAHTIPAPKDPEDRRRAWRLYPGGRAVHHPGAKKQPFFTDAAEQSKGEVERVMSQVAEEAAAEVAAGV